jgi:small-conductance mechanosensitive channel
MSDPKEAWPCLAPDRAKFAAREYVASIERGVVARGEVLSPDYVESMSLAHESGYLRGSNDAYEDLLKQLVELRANAREAGRLESEAGRLESENEHLATERDLLRRETEALQQANEATQHLTEALRREHETLLRLEEALASEVRATKAMKQLEERIQVLEARKAEAP